MFKLDGQSTVRNTVVEFKTPILVCQQYQLQNFPSFQNDFFIFAPAITQLTALSRKSRLADTCSPLPSTRAWPVGFSPWQQSGSWLE